MKIIDKIYLVQKQYNGKVECAFQSKIDAQKFIEDKQTWWNEYCKVQNFRLFDYTNTVMICEVDYILMENK